MNPGALGAIVLFLVIGCLLGWFTQKTTAAHSDVKVARTRLSGGRKTRWRSAVLVLVIGAIIVLVFRDAVHPG